MRLLLGFELRRAYSSYPGNGGGRARLGSLARLGLCGGRRRGTELFDLEGKHHAAHVDGPAAVVANGWFVRASQRPTNHCKPGDLRALETLFRKAWRWRTRCHRLLSRRRRLRGMGAQRDGGCRSGTGPSRVSRSRI